MSDPSCADVFNVREPAGPLMLDGAIARAPLNQPEVVDPDTGEAMGPTARACLAGVVGVLFVLNGGEARALRMRDATFHSNRDGSKVYIDGKYVGDTPLELEFHCGDIGDRRYRIEHEGCEPAEGILNARVSAGSIVGASFTAGITLIFSARDTSSR